MPLLIPRAEISDSQALAGAFGWSPDSLRHRSVELSGGRVDVARTTISGESALVFAHVSDIQEQRALEAAALFSYHVAAEWGVIADGAAGIKVFNSRWSYQDEWYSLPTISWSALRADEEVIRALSPQGIVEGSLSRIAENQRPPTRVLLPVDDSLVERLDRWRVELLRFSKLDVSADALLQRLYAQLFVLRTVEDRALDASVPRLSTILSSRTGEVVATRWTRLLRIARARIGGELFAGDAARDMPQHILRGVIEDLYTPRGIPGASARYDFSWMDADVLGAAYEKYLATVLQPGAFSPQDDMFLSTEREVETVSVRKRKGAFYTPKFMTNYLAVSTIDDVFERLTAPAIPRAIDFACGSGAFLVAAIDRILFHLKRVDPDRNWAAELVEGKHVVGIDIDINAVNLARLRIWQRLLEEPGALPLPSLVDIVKVGDGLNRETWGELNRDYDVVLGNPPFLATEKVDSREVLEARFSTACGRYDFSSLFVEQAVRVLRIGGSLGMVVPNRFFRNTSGASLRDLLSREVSMSALVDFGTTRPFEAHAYVGCIVGSRRAPSSQVPRTLVVTEVESLDCDFLAQLLLAPAALRGSGCLKTYSARYPTGAEPWLLMSEGELQTRTMLEEATVGLSTLAEITQGIKTGANDFFIFEVISDDRAQLIEAVNGLGDRVILERELLEPVIYGSELQRYSLVSPTKRILYPYRSGAVITEGQLRSRFPRTWDYFEGYRNVLGVRSSIQQRNASFFELVRQRDEAWLRRPKLLIRDLAPKTSFALDHTGTTFLVGGTAVTPEDSSLLLVLLAYLNSSFVNDYLRQSTPSFNGGYQKFEPKHLQSLPVLSRLLEDPILQAELTELAWAALGESGDQAHRQVAEERIDEIIASLVAEAA